MKALRPADRPFMPKTAFTFSPSISKARSGTRSSEVAPWEPYLRAGFFFASSAADLAPSLGLM